MGWKKKKDKGREEEGRGSMGREIKEEEERRGIKRREGGN